MNQVIKALKIAGQYHAKQKERNGSPYIFHPVRVAESVKSDTAKVVALLHDTVEDTELTIEEVYKEFGKEVADAVKLITKVKGQDYQEYLEGIKTNRIATVVKLADLKDNRDLTRLPEITAEDRKRQLKYKEAVAFLSN